MSNIKPTITPYKQPPRRPKPRLGQLRCLSCGAFLPQHVDHIEQDLLLNVDEDGRVAMIWLDGESTRTCRRCHNESRSDEFKDSSSHLEQFGWWRPTPPHARSRSLG